VPSSKKLTPLSKFLALLLRHKAAAFGLALDGEGYTDLAAVWAQVQRRFGDTYDHDDLLRVIDGDGAGKKRYELRDDKIRALYGHSDVGEVTYPPAVPPKHLYHGTTAAALIIIRQQGLSAQKRQYVHLTTNLERAKTVATRHDEQIIVLTVRAAEAHRRGIVFYHPEAEHYLARTVPVEFIVFTEEPHP
jgi:putative RNA 2'-phosphotransferase